MSLIPCTDDCLFQKDGCCHLQHATSSGTLGTPAFENFSPLSSGSRARPKENGRSGCVHYTQRPR